MPIRNISIKLNYAVLPSPIFAAAMDVYYNLDNLPEFKNAVVTIGSFDGVHLGHQSIIELLINEAKAINGETVLITFDPHPRKVLDPTGNHLQLLNTTDEKLEILRSLQVEHVVVVPFDTAFAEQTAEEYIVDFLWKKFNPHTVVIGYDHHFGKGRKGNYQLLEQYAAQLGFEVKEIPSHQINEVAISSTKIRTALLNNDIKTANQLLGYPYSLQGTVVQGNQLGRTIGFPTANIEVSNTDKLIPANGVYAVELRIDNTIFHGMMNIGVRPTVKGTGRVIEVNIFDFKADIYGALLTIYFKHFLRHEQKFDGLESLQEQLQKDKITAIQFLKQ